MPTTTSAHVFDRQIAAGPWLRPIPGLRRTDPEHRYWLGEHLFAVSVTGVIGSTKSEWAMARIEATRHVWEPRGHTVHLALEALLHSRFHPLPQQRQQASQQLQHLRSGDYRDWIEPLLAHPHWRQVTAIASERPTCCLIRNLAGTYDTGYIQHASGLRVLADLKTLSRPGSGSYCTRASWAATWRWRRPGVCTTTPARRSGPGRGRPASRRCTPAKTAWRPGQQPGRAT